MEIGYGPTKIWERRGERNWIPKSVETAVRRMRLNGGIVERKKRSGQPKSVVSSVIGHELQRCWSALQEIPEPTRAQGKFGMEFRPIRFQRACSE
ncbi:hypothetical protein L596_018744 [Steinernema carpocapsae]|uniref:Uncharacterized protein n=1 Tax=Steinernema carpocapsae TaxID=34508 RepID=A0A4U5N6A7_STECR|nr:hypothetical protein L596_018744 [Steinernema carpocapsae]